MPKLKSHKSTAKRVEITGNGTMKRSLAGKIHFNEKKSPRHKRSLAGKATIKGKIAKNLKRALGR